MNNYGFFGGGFNIPPFAQNPFYQTAPNISYHDDAPIWFVALAPMFSLFLESIAGDKIAAVVLWVFTFVLCVLICKRDYNKYVKPIAFNNFNIEKTVYIPLLYLIKRKKVFPTNKLYVVVCIISLLVAATQNGFVQALLYNDTTYINTIKQSACYRIDDVANDKNVLDITIEDAIKDFSRTNDINWSCEKISSGEFEITADFDAYYNSRLCKLSLSFQLLYDGFSYGGLSVKTIEIDNRVLSEADKAALVMNIFTDYSADDSSNKSDSSYIEV